MSNNKFQSNNSNNSRLNAIENKCKERKIKQDRKNQRKYKEQRCSM